ncbi:MAG TPA: IclR family transcriptional regulator [Actinomycetota bacterium]|jgi:DNA-binding IclR family transcriptional regulator|nr:IclR family transcriptional regulator [Actinomycetota bacterium]
MRATEAVDRVAAVLDLLADSPHGLSVTEVGDALGVHKATASRLLGTLAGHGLVERTRERRYRVGIGIVRYAASALSELGAVSRARPELEALSRASRETVSLGVLDGTDVLYIDQVTGRERVVFADWAGRRSPAHCSSSGKVLLAHLDDARLEAFLSRPLDARTERTIVDPATLRGRLDEIRRRGYERSIGELEDGLSTAAAPVWSRGKVVAAVSVGGPSSRLPARELPRLGRLAIEAAQAIGRRLGQDETVDPFQVPVR